MLIRVAAPKNNAFGAHFYRIWPLKNAALFQGLIFSQKKKVNCALSCMRKGPKCIQTLWDHPKKIPFVQKHTKKSRYVRSLGKKPHFGAFPEAEKSCCRSQLHAQRSQMHCKPFGTIRKNSFCVKVQRNRDMSILREKTPFSEHSQTLKKLIAALGWCAKAPACKHQIPLGHQKKFIWC